MIPLPCEHPIDPTMREQAMQAMAQLEREHDVTIVFACESGSRAWGFASPDSDYDVRFVYVQRPRRYMTVHSVRDVIEQPISGDLDVNGWDLRKALGLLQASNPTLQEWLRSPIVYRSDEIAAQGLLALSEQFYSPLACYHHYVSMAKKTFREHLKGETVRFKKYLYALRPLLAARWIHAGRGAPPMPFATLAHAMVDDEALLADLHRLLTLKMQAGEAATSAPWPRLQQFIETELEAAQAKASDVPAADKNSRDPRELDEFLYAQVMAHAADRSL